MDRGGVQHLLLAGIVAVQLDRRENWRGRKSIRRQYSCRGKVRDRGAATLRILPVEGVPAAAADGNRVVVGVLVRSARGLQPGPDRSDDHPDDHRLRAGY